MLWTACCVSLRRASAGTAAIRAARAAGSAASDAGSASLSSTSTAVASAGGALLRGWGGEKDMALGSLSQQGAQHPRRLLMHRQALGQQVGRGLLIGFVGQREQVAGGAGHG